MATAWDASERARLVAAGKTPSFVGGQVAAIARVNALVLVTANVSDYEGFEGLTIADRVLASTNKAPPQTDQACCPADRLIGEILVGPR